MAPHEWREMVRFRIAGKARVVFPDLARAVGASSPDDQKALRLVLKASGYRPAGRRFGNASTTWRLAA